MGREIDGRTHAGRFVRATVRELTAYLGGAPSAPQRLLIARLARVALRLELLERKIDSGEGTDYDLKVLGGLGSQFRLMLGQLDAMNHGAHKPAASKDHDWGTSFIRRDRVPA